MLRMIIEISVPRSVHKFDQISNIILKCCALSGDNGERNVQYHTSTRFFHLQSVTQCCRDRSRTSWEIRELGQKPAEIETKSVVFNFQSRGVHFQSCTSADAVLILGALWTSEASTDLVWLGPWKPLCIPFTCIAQWCSVMLSRSEMIPQESFGVLGIQASGKNQESSGSMQAVNCVF